MQNGNVFLSKEQRGREKASRCCGHGGGYEVDGIVVQYRDSCAGCTQRALFSAFNRTRSVCCKALVCLGIKCVSSLACNINKFSLHAFALYRMHIRLIQLKKAKAPTHR